MARRLRGRLLNIRSLGIKFENIPDMFNEHTLSFLALMETWHEHSDSVTMRRWSFGYNVVELMRPIPASAKRDNLQCTNHGGVALLSKSGIHLSKVDMRMATTTFEHLCCRVEGGFSPFLLVVVYGP